MIWVDLFVLVVLKNALSNKYNNEKIFASTWRANKHVYFKIGL